MFFCKLFNKRNKEAKGKTIKKRRNKTTDTKGLIIINSQKNRNGAKKSVTLQIIGN